MNISTISNLSYFKNVTNDKQLQKSYALPSTTRTQNNQKPDAISSATKTTGGDHYFEAKA